MVLLLALCPMAQLLDCLPKDWPDRIICCYVNATSKIQIGRISNVPNWYFERVVFPGQRLIFETTPQAQLEIHTGMMASAILSDTIPCDRLIVKETQESITPTPETQQEVEAKNEGEAGQAMSMPAQLTAETLS